MLYWPSVVYGGCVSAIGNNRLLLFLLSLTTDFGDRDWRSNISACVFHGSGTCFRAMVATLTF